MAILKKQRRVGKQQIDISGSGGNAYALMGTARSLARQIGLDGTAIIDEMTSGDYENLLKVFDREFGSVFDLVR